MKNTIKPHILLILFSFFNYSCKKEKDSFYVTQDNFKTTTRSFENKLNLLNKSTPDSILVVAHRGDWRNAPENSLQAINNCINMGVDIVEIDVRETKDGHLVLMHDKTINRTTNGKGKVNLWTLDSIKRLKLKNGLGRTTYNQIPTLREVMLSVKGKVLVNIDKAYSIFDKVYEVLKETGTTGQVIMKGNVSVAQLEKEFGQYLREVYFMPVINMENPDALQIIEDYQHHINPVAYELVFPKVNNKVYAAFDSIHKYKSNIWVNSLWKSLNGGYEDEIAVRNPDSIYGWYLENKINIIQTDRPELLIEYLTKEKEQPQ